MDRPEHFVLILDDYHRITEPQIHDTLRYLVEHLPHQLHIILATRTDPPLSLSLLQTREQVLQIRTNQLACTVEETKAFLQEVTGIQLPDQTIQEITTRTEGWLVGLQLLGLSLSGCHNPTIILDELSGDQRYIQDFLIEEVLQRQSQEMQTFLLSTCILERFTASLCDAVMQQAGSQCMLEQLERANLFVVPLDTKRQWYRYHALFAEALRYRLEHTHPDLAPTLHHRASLWYAEHNQTTQAILHAFSACQWQWAADLIEPLPVTSLAWGAGEHELVLLRHWLQQLPKDIVESRPHLCLACAQMLWTTCNAFGSHTTFKDVWESKCIITNHGTKLVAYSRNNTDCFTCATYGRGCVRPDAHFPREAEPGKSTWGGNRLSHLSIELSGEWTGHPCALPASIFTALRGKCSSSCPACSSPNDSLLYFCQ